VDFTFEVERSLRVLERSGRVFEAWPASSRMSETVWRQAGPLRRAALLLINKLEPDWPNFWRGVESIKDRLGANAVPIQIPIGHEDRFEGIVDLVEMKAYYYRDDRDDIRRQGHPGGAQAEAEKHRHTMIEAVPRWTTS